MLKVFSFVIFSWTQPHMLYLPEFEHDYVELASQGNGMLMSTCMPLSMLSGSWFYYSFCCRVGELIIFTSAFAKNFTPPPPPPPQLKDRFSTDMAQTFKIVLVYCYNFWHADISESDKTWLLILHVYLGQSLFEPQRRKPVFGVPGQVRHSPRKWLEAWNFELWKKRDCAIYVGKTKMLISCAVTAQLICIFVVTSANQRTIGPVNAHLISGSRFHWN